MSILLNFKLYLFPPFKKKTCSVCWKLYWISCWFTFLGLGSFHCLDSLTPSIFRDNLCDHICKSLVCSFCTSVFLWSLPQGGFCACDLNSSFSVSWIFSLIGVWRIDDINRNKLLIQLCNESITGFKAKRKGKGSLNHINQCEIA